MILDCGLINCEYDCSADDLPFFVGDGMLVAIFSIISTSIKVCGKINLFMSPVASVVTRSF